MKWKSIIKIVVAIFFSLILIGGLYAFKVVPLSAQVYIAGLADCNNLEEALAEDGTGFEGIYFWEPPLAHIYRWYQWYFGKDFIITDSIVTNESVLSILLTASDNTKQMCNKEIIELANHYHELGAPIDHYSELGYTPLQITVMTGNNAFVRLFLSFGADKTLKVQREDALYTGMSAVEIAEYIHSMHPDYKQWELINTVLSDSD